MKIPYQIILPAVPLLGAVAQEQKPLQIAPPVSDFSLLATEWAKEYLRYNHGSSDYPSWIDFDASRQETQTFCESQDARRRLKGCKLEIEQKDFSIDTINNVSPGKKTLFWQNHINNSSEPDEGSINKEFSYKDVNNVITTKGFRRSISTGFDAHVGGSAWFGNWGINADFRFNIEWNTSDTNEQRHEESRQIAIGEKFVFPPYSKTKITFLLQEANYDLDFSTNVDIGGFFVFKCYSNGVTYIFEPYDILKEIKSNPSRYSEYLKVLTKHYELLSEKEEDYSYFKLRYNATGKMQGIYGYQVDSKKESVPLSSSPIETVTQSVTTAPITKTISQTLTPTHTNQGNSLGVNKYSSIGTALLSAVWLLGR